LRWIDHIQDYTYYREASAFALLIRDFWVVEFLRHPNAAYIYERSVWEKYRPPKSRCRDASSLKFWDLKRGRIIHQPGWQHRADEQLGLWRGGR
jgi:hypothetical protein